MWTAFILFLFSFCSVAAEGNPQGSEPPEHDVTTDKPSTLEQPFSFSRKRSRAWYDKLNYFVWAGAEHKRLDLSRAVTNPAIKSSLLQADYDSQLYSFNAGGNIFDRTSVNMDIAYNKFTLEGDVVDTNQDDVTLAESVRFTRNKLLTELFVEYDLRNGYTLGTDLYYGVSRYRNRADPVLKDTIFTDKEVGGGLMLSKTFRFEQAELKTEYILSYRRLLPGDPVFSKQSRTFHNVLLSYNYHWSFDVSIDTFGRYSWYPRYDEGNFWDTKDLFAAGAEVSWRIQDNLVAAFRAERMQYGDGDTLDTVSINIEYQFGASDSKRRKRRRKIPQLLIR